MHAADTALDNHLKTRAEWLETDGYGGYSMGCADHVPRRKYHGLYILPPDEGGIRRIALHHPWIEVHDDSEICALSSFQFSDHVLHPVMVAQRISFSHQPWPTWEYRWRKYRFRIELVLLHHRAAGVYRLSLSSSDADFDYKQSALSVRMRVFSSFRNHHELTASQLETVNHHFNESELHLSHPASDCSLTLTTNGRFEESIQTYYNFYYSEERARGYPFSEDLLSHGIFTFSLSAGAAHIFFSRESSGGTAHTASWIESELTRERAYRESFGSLNARALSQYIIKTNERTSIIAGYPWFGEWGRDSLIVSRGVRALTNGDLIYRSMILSWCRTLHNGLIPNRFPDASTRIEYNSVDATLWLLLAIGELLRDDHSIRRTDRQVLIDSVNTIIDHLQRGTDYNIVLDQDGLLRAGTAGVQLTWMDAKIGSWVVTPRIGKPIEVQALWINSLLLLEPEIPSLRSLTERAQKSFSYRFFLPDLGYCADVIDCDHQEGTIDTSLRPNQIFALGALPFPLVSREQAHTALNIIERELVTPYGLRSLSTRNPLYKGRYEGDQTERDAAYHQGTVWSWLLPPFAEAWARAHGDSSSARREAVARFLQPLQEYSQHHGGHIPEIFDGDKPHIARGAPFQAWSVSELFRVSATFQTRTISRAFLEFFSR